MPDDMHGLTVGDRTAAANRCDAVVRDGSVDAHQAPVGGVARELPFDHGDPRVDL